MPTCDCAAYPEPHEVHCDECSAPIDECICDDEPPHVGHWSRLGGQWWCDTCNSPYCELA